MERIVLQRQQLIPRSSTVLGQQFRRYSRGVCSIRHRLERTAFEGIDIANVVKNKRIIILERRFHFGKPGRMLFSSMLSN